MLSNGGLHEKHPSKFLYNLKTSLDKGREGKLIGNLNWKKKLV